VTDPLSAALPADPLPAVTQESPASQQAASGQSFQDPNGYNGATQFMPFTLPPARAPFTMPPAPATSTTTTRKPAPNGFMQVALPLLSGVQNVVEQAEKMVSPGTAKVQKKAEQVPHVSSGTVVNLCTNSDDELWKSEAGQSNWQRDMTSCGGKCFGDASCVTSCMQGVGWSSGCSGCFGALAVCTVSNCVAQCIDGRTPACVTCLTAVGCDTAAFGTGSCTGLKTPSLLPAEAVVPPSAAAGNANAAASTVDAPLVIAGNTNAGLTVETDDAATRLKQALRERAKIEALLASVRSKLDKHSTGPVQVQQRTNSAELVAAPRTKSLPQPIKEKVQKVSQKAAESGSLESVGEKVKKGSTGPVTTRVKKDSSETVERNVREESSEPMKDTPEQNAKKGHPAPSEGKAKKDNSETNIGAVLQRLQEKATKTSPDPAIDAHRLFLTTFSRLAAASGSQSNFLSLACVAVAVVALMALMARFVRIRFTTPAPGERSYTEVSRE